jgi:hypothetical protein
VAVAGEEGDLAAAEAREGVEGFFLRGAVEGAGGLVENVD